MEESKGIGVGNTLKELDAGAMFVLKSKGSWLHCGYHLTTSIVAPALLSLPFAMGLLGWVGGVICLALAGLVAFYSYNLLSLVLEHNAKLGQRQLRFRDMARDILGPGWGKYFVGPFQLWTCFGAVIAGNLLGGQSLKCLLAANKRSARTHVCRPNTRKILHSQHHNKIGFSNIIRDHSTTVAAMFPFFRDINAVIGAFRCIPLDFILPMIFYNVTFKPSKNSLIFWGNTVIASIYSALGMLGAI